ncbi:Na+/H+ antiporter NhaC [Spirochaetia bacterium]|nr:Na+/H+ antiporter NhaC [Spirochaetia bacterium]
MAKEKGPEKEGAFGSSLLVFLIVAGVLGFGIIGLKLGAHIPLIIATMVVTIYGVILHIPLSELEASMWKSIKDSLVVLGIIMIVGTLIANWILCGTIPYIIYLGLKAFNPGWFLGFVVVMCGILSSVTGSSWTTAGTIGIAFLGISGGLGIPLPMTAGAICCGAFFGDKQSPVSDYAIFAAGVTRVNIYRHCKNMLWTTGPAFLICIVLFFIIGAKYHTTGNVQAGEVDALIQALEGMYNFNLLLWLPLIVLIATIFLKLPGIYTMFLASITGGIVALITQGATLADVLNVMFNGFSAETGNAELNRIVNRGGMINMAYTLMLIMCALAMGGVLDRTKVLKKIVTKISGFIKNRIGLIMTTFVSCGILEFFAGDCYVAGYVTVKALEKKYDEMKIGRPVLSRTISDTFTLTHPLTPWGISGVFLAQTLGVPVSQYAPWYFLAFITPLFMILWGIVGGKATPVATEEELAELQTGD